MESALYSIYALAIFVSEISLIRMRQQLVHKYHTPALSMKYFSTFNQLESSKFTPFIGTCSLQRPLQHRFAVDILIN